ncbi:MAG: glutaminase A [Chloroflexi bacterium]|uniref:Glutaminase n=1 Tax=Candidatus Chlorohelix allophototropha TaxID=3003348 RepID=A0A8T7M262_9CHLR|nr:glutaminase A [Chloroflexota bacterium]WJW67851.1 glutaminase A [Chloroflexota bacterium L227-S17]
MNKQDDRNDLEILVSEMKAIKSPLRRYLNELYAKYKTLDEGKVADYIPELAKAKPDWFSICVVKTNGQVFEVGDSRQDFTIQSMSKPFMYGLALEQHGREFVSTKVGVEPTGEAFNSIILDEASNRPFNPMVNAGAIATAALIRGEDPPTRLNRVLDMFERYTGRKASVDIAVFASEKQTGNRNRAIGYLMLNFGMVPPNLDESLDLYFQQCSLLVNCRDMAVMAATLANNGINPTTGQRAVEAQYIPDILSVMYTSGMYNYAGQWAYSVGIPAKSGVSGGIIGVVPGKLGIAVFSPLLDSQGNSVRGIKVCEQLSRELGLHIFNLSNQQSELLD